MGDYIAVVGAHDDFKTLKIIRLPSSFLSKVAREFSCYYDINGDAEHFMY